MNFNNPQLKAKVKSAPLEPGCYLYKGSKEEVIYVGKAKSIRKRVASYFRLPHEDEFTNQLVEQIQDVEFVTTESELDALLLEANLIKKYVPRFNRMLKDDKSYVWIMITKQDDFPQIKIVREKKLKSARYLGPYPSTVPVKRILKSLRKTYNYRSCNRVITESKDQDGKRVIKSSDPKPCLYYHLNLCQAPCAGQINKNKYRGNINNISRFFRRGKKEMMIDLKKKMQTYSQNQQYEKAAQLRDEISDLEYISQFVRIDRGTDDVNYKKVQKKGYLKGLDELVTKLDVFEFSSNPDFRIECYDISNIQGTNAVGSMVVNVGGKASKSDYRKFRIRSKDTPDDFFMMQEVLTRRLKKLSSEDKSFSKTPDLIIIDGGKGQLHSAYKVLQELGVSIPIVGLAKKLEELFFVKDNEEVSFGRRTLRYHSEGYFLIQRIRDESHRFAINYHRQLRSHGQIKSILDDIPGIGKLTKKKLLLAFGSAEGIRKASVKDLQTVVKNKRTVENLKKILNKK